MRRYRTKKMPDGKWAVLMHIGPQQFAPVKGEIYDTEKEASTARDHLKYGSKKV